MDRRPDNYVTYDNDIAVGQDGTPHVVWSECPRGTYFQKTMYARRDHDTWTIPINVSRDSGDFRAPAIVADTAGLPLVVWSEQYAARIRYTRPNGDTWLMPKLAFARSGVVPRMVVDIGNRVHMLFGEIGGSGSVWYSFYDSGADSWAVPSLAADDSGDLGWHDLTADRFGRLHAVWMNYRTYGVDYSVYDGDTWSTPEHLPDPAPSGQSCDPRIACDTLGRPHVVWEERYGGYWVYYSWRDGDSWTTPYRLYDQNGGRPKVCCDEADRTHVIWNWTYGVLHRTKVGDTWRDPIAVTTSGAAMLHELARSPGRLHLSYRDDWGVFYSTHPTAGGIAEATARPGLARLTAATQAGGSARLRFEVSEWCDVAVSFWDSAGRLALSCSLGRLGPGRHDAVVPVRQLPSGTYVCRLKAGGRLSAAKTVVLK
ncbi:hypothetical protein FJY71_02245 [candidate division WOR-3 bacterium]|nr:hypothetical protein [candidate division WOR-3 bacterium]